MSDTKTLRHNQSAIETFISIADKIFGAGGPGAHELPPLERKSRGQSRPALTPAAMKYIENTENRRTAKVVTPYIEALREVPRNYYLGYDLYTLVCLCGWNTHDHGYLRNLKAPEDDEGRRELEAWNFVTMLIATKATKQLEAQGRNPKLKVVVSPKDATEDSDPAPLVKESAKHHRNRRYGVEHAYRLIADYFAERLASAGDIGTAEWETAKRFDCSTRKVRRAREFKDAS